MPTMLLRPWRGLGCLLVLLLVGVSPAPAQAPTELADALAPIPTGTPVRVLTRGGEWAQGALVGLEGEVLVVRETAGERRFPAAEVGEVRVRGRQTRRGAVIGGAVVGVASLLYSAWFGALVATTGDADAGDAAALAAGGGLLGAAGGALTGGIIGSTVTRWRRVYPAEGAGPRVEPADPAPPALPTAAEPVEPWRIASLEVTAGYAGSPHDGGTGGGPAARAALLGEFDPGERGGTVAAVGLEAGWSALGSTPVLERTFPRWDPQSREPGEDTVRFRRRYRVQDFGGVARVGLAGGARPYALLGAGVSAWRTDAVDRSDAPQSRPITVGTRYVGGLSVGAGARLRSLGGPYALGVEGRWHTHLFPGQREPDSAGGFWTVGATLGRSW